MTRPYELYVDGRFAVRTLTLGKAIKISNDKFQGHQIQVFKITEVPQTVLVYKANN